MPVRIVSALQAAEIDRRTIARGVLSRTLMQAAGRAAAQLLVDRFPLETSRGVAIYAGPGNNGGDAWVVAATLAHRGIRVRVAEVVPAKTPDAIAEREAASAVLQHSVPDGSEGVIVDGLLGTGSTGAPHGPIAGAIEQIAAAAARGTPVVSLDIPSGVDATSGEAPGAHVSADLTVTFGAIKRGLLVNRDASGEIIAVDIGVASEADRFDDAPLLVNDSEVIAAVPPISADAHKGTRKRLLIVGGSAGFAGSTVLAARGAMCSGIGMVKLCVERASIAAVQTSEPAAMAAAWPESDAELADLLAWANVMLIGPGLGVGDTALAFARRMLKAWRGPVVVDADALRAFTGAASELGALLAGRPAVITPHAVEFSRLAGMDLAEVNARRFEIAGELARTVHATVLLKGVPTVISDGAISVVCAAGTPVLATGGSGDVLGGMVATLVAQTNEPRVSAAAAAWVHGRAAEIAGAGRIRGVVLEDVIGALRHAWPLSAQAAAAPVLAELPAVGGRAARTPPARAP
jgi:NAD(P)H-hydrate epimerase